MKLEHIGGKIWTCDLTPRHEPSDHAGWNGALMRLAGPVGGECSTPPEWRLSFLNRAQARAAVRTALSRQPERQVIARCEWVRSDGLEAPRRGLRRLSS